MTSQINTDNIDATYPVAGQDNDTQGFRDNFSNITAALSTAKGEITKLQSNTLLAANLSDNSVVTNDLQGSSINNGYYNNFYGTFYNEPVTDTTVIDVTNGSVQKFTVPLTSPANNKDYNFRGWPENGIYGIVRVHFVIEEEVNAPQSITLHTDGGGDIVKDDSFPPTLTVGITGKHQVVEAWTYNSGATVFVKYLGEF